MDDGKLEEERLSGEISRAYERLISTRRGLVEATGELAEHERRAKVENAETLLEAKNERTASLYLDGALASIITFSGTPLFMKPDQELRIGMDYPTEPMRGAIDEVRIYNRVLSPAEAAALAGRTEPFYEPF